VTAAREVPDVQAVPPLLPLQPLPLQIVGDPSAAACEGDSCAIDGHH
jgi:hypothetical protein